MIVRKGIAGAMLLVVGVITSPMKTLAADWQEAPALPAASTTPCDIDKQRTAASLGVPCDMLTDNSPPNALVTPPAAAEPSRSSALAPAPSGRAAVTPAGQAKLFIIRDQAEPLLFPANILLDDKKAVSLWQHSYAEISVASGAHQLGIHWFLLAKQPDYDRDVRLASGRTYYFVVDSHVRLAGNYGVGLRLVSTNGVREIPEQEATVLIRNCCARKMPDQSFASE